jgi:hypothetical protein
MSGVVKTVTGSSLSIENGGGEIVFSVDPNTSIILKGARAHINDLVGRPGPRVTAVIKNGDLVTVKYRL